MTRDNARGSRAHFEDLLAEALLEPLNTDYEALREAWIACDGPERVVRDEEAIEELHMRLATQRWEAARDLAEELLDAEPLCVQLRLWLARATEGLGEEREASNERAFANGLVRAILRSGDGASPEHALRVIHTREIALVLGVMDLQAQRSELREVDGRWIDRVECTGLEGPRTVYFHVAVPECWMVLGENLEE
jgi:hypothetical protein